MKQSLFFTNLIAFVALIYVTIKSGTNIVSTIGIIANIVSIILIIILDYKIRKGEQ